MKKILFLLMVGFLLIGTNLYAGDGDLIVDGKVGIGTQTPTNKLELHNGNIMLNDNITQGYTVSPNKIIWLCT